MPSRYSETLTFGVLSPGLLTPTASTEAGISNDDCAVRVAVTTTGGSGVSSATGSVADAASGAVTERQAATSGRRVALRGTGLHHYCWLRFGGSACDPNVSVRACAFG